MVSGRRRLVEVTYRELRPGDQNGQLRYGRKVIAAPKLLPGGKVELRMEWTRTGKPDRATPLASRKVQVEREIRALRHSMKARSTGGTVEVWNTSDDDTEVTADQVRGHLWAMRCEHGTVVGRRTQKEALDDVRDPRLWCVDCVGPAGQVALPL